MIGPYPFHLPQQPRVPILLSAQLFYPLVIHLDAISAARVIVEVGTHSAWVREVVAGCGHEVLVANPRLMDGRKRRKRKNDRIDANKTPARQRQALHSAVKVVLWVFNGGLRTNGCTAGEEGYTVRFKDGAIRNFPDLFVAAFVPAVNAKIAPHADFGTLGLMVVFTRVPPTPATRFRTSAPFNPRGLARAPRAVKCW